jgi:YVTN family beta-propeller protein
MPVARILAGAIALLTPVLAASVETVPGMPPVADEKNLYSEIATGKVSSATAGHRELVYVPHVQSNDVYVIDPKTLKVIDKFKVGLNPQHVAPSWDLQTLWVTNNAERTDKGSLTPIDPKTGKPGEAIPVDDPYNMYFSPDGKSAIVVAEAMKRLDFRDPKTFKLQYSIAAPQCAGINHADFSIDGKYAIFTCEFAKSLVKIDLVNRKVMGYLKLSKGGMPQDIRSSPDGKRFYVADMMADGVFIVDFESFKEVGFIATGKGTHGLYPSRDGKKLYVANRGSNKVHGAKSGPGSVSVVDFATEKIERHVASPRWRQSRHGECERRWQAALALRALRPRRLCVRYDDGPGEDDQGRIEPHGLTVWPQPGRYSLGHTGNMR